MALAVLGFVAGQVVSAVLLVIVASANGHLHDLAQLSARTVPPAWVVVSGLVGLWVGFVGAVVVASRRSGTGNVLRDMGLWFRPADFLVGPLVGLAGQLVLLPLLYVPLEHVVPHLSQRLQQPAKHLTGGFPGADLAVIAVLTVVVVPLVEETVFRGLFLRGALRAFSGAGRVAGPVLATVLTGIVFALAHFEALQILGLAAFGVVLSVLAYRTGRLGPCVTAHAAFNLVAILAVAAVH
jgi:membrane protease YdiL (CAAX protease family)